MELKLNIEKIKKEMERLGWSHYRLAGEMDCNRQWVYNLLSSDYGGVTLKTVDKLAKALYMDPKDLLI